MPVGLITKMLLLFATVLLLGGCERVLERMMGARTGAATETVDAICRELQADMPTRSHLDTRQTQDLLGAFYDVYEEVCQREAFPASEGAS